MSTKTKTNSRLLGFTTLFIVISLLMTPVSAQSNQQPTFTANLYPADVVGPAIGLDVRISNLPTSIPDSSMILITLPPEIKIIGSSFDAICVSGLSKRNTRVETLAPSMLVLSNGGPYDSTEMRFHIIGTNINTNYFVATQNVTNCFVLKVEHSVDTIAKLIYTPTILPTLLPDAALELRTSSVPAKSSLKLTFTAPTVLPNSFVIVMKASQDLDSDIKLFSDVKACRVINSNNDTTISTRFPCSSAAAGIIEISYRASQPVPAGSSLTVEIGHVATIAAAEASVPMEIYIQTDGRQATIAETTVLSVTSLPAVSLVSRIRSMK